MLDDRSKVRLKGVHPDLVRVIDLASTRASFIVTEGLRTKERQAELFKAGASKTMNSRHLTGHAVDLAVKVGDEIRWDWPLYEELAEVVKKCARELEIPIVAGADWVKFRDGPHFELDRKVYP